MADPESFRLNRAGPAPPRTRIVGDHLHHGQHRRPDAYLQHDARLQRLPVPIATGRGHLRHSRNGRDRQPVSPHPRPDGRVCPIGQQRLCGRRRDFCGASGRKLWRLRCPPPDRRSRAIDRAPPRHCALGRSELHPPFASARHRAARGFQNCPHVRHHRRSVVAGDARRSAPMPARTRLRGDHGVRPLWLDRAWRVRAMPRGWRLAQPHAGASVPRDRRPGDRTAAPGRRTRRAGRHAS